MSNSAAITQNGRRATYQLESWDGYLIALARTLGAKVVYSQDEEFSKVREVSVSNPFPRDKLHEYHEYVSAKLDEGHPSGSRPTGLRSDTVVNQRRPQYTCQLGMD